MLKRNGLPAPLPGRRGALLGTQDAPPPTPPRRRPCRSQWSPRVPPPPALLALGRAARRRLPPASLSPSYLNSLLPHGRADRLPSVCASDVEVGRGEAIRVSRVSSASMRPTTEALHRRAIAERIVQVFDRHAPPRAVLLTGS